MRSVLHPSTKFRSMGARFALLVSFNILLLLGLLIYTTENNSRSLAEQTTGSEMLRSPGCPDLSLETVTFATDAVRRMDIRTPTQLVSVFPYAGYDDERTAQRHIRFTGLVDVKHKNILVNETWCVVWFQHRLKPLSIRGFGHIIWLYFPKYQTFVFSCLLPDNVNERPLFAGLSGKQCEQPTSVVKIKSMVKPVWKSNGTSVCSKVMYGQVDPVRLVEWLEVNRLIGAEKIYVYTTNVKGVASDVLSHYSARGFVRVEQHQFLEKFSREILNSSFPTPDYPQNWELEVLSVMDCLLTCSEKYLVLIDIDEILYPTLHQTFASFVQFFRKQHQNVAAYLFRTAVFSDEFKQTLSKQANLPPFVHTLNHNVRTRIDWESSKSIVDTDQCLAVAHHSCFETHSPLVVGAIQVPERFGYVRHYREKCRLTGTRNKCQNLLREPYADDSLLYLKDHLIGRMKPLLNKFKLL